MLNRRTLLSAAAATACVLAGAPALAQDFPTRAITIIVGFPPGGGVDGPLRQVADRMSKSLGVPIVIDNVPGANQILAIRKLTRAAPDGYTLFAGTGSSLSQNPVLDPSLAYDPLTDFSLIGRFAQSPAILVVPASSPWKTFEELVTYGRANPGQLRYASAGIGSTSHIGLEVLSQKLGISMLHVPYRGDAAAAVDTAEARVDLGLNVSTTLIPFIPTGKLRLLATTSTTPLPYAPQLRSLAAVAGPDLGLLDPYTFYGLVGPHGVPQTILDKLSHAMNEAVKAPELVRNYRDVMYAEPVAETPKDFRNFLQRQLGAWKPYASKFAK